MGVASTYTLHMTKSSPRGRVCGEKDVDEAKPVIPVVISTHVYMHEQLLLVHLAHLVACCTTVASRPHCCGARIDPAARYSPPGVGLACPCTLLSKHPGVILSKKGETDQWQRCNLLLHLAGDRMLPGSHVNHWHVGLPACSGPGCMA